MIMYHTHQQVSIRKHVKGERGLHVVGLSRLSSLPSVVGLYDVCESLGASLAASCTPDPLLCLAFLSVLNRKIYVDVDVGRLFSDRSFPRRRFQIIDTPFVFLLNRVLSLPPHCCVPAMLVVSFVLNGGRRWRPTCFENNAKWEGAMHLWYRDLRLSLRCLRHRLYLPFALLFFFGQVTQLSSASFCAMAAIARHLLMHAVESQSDTSMCTERTSTAGKAPVDHLTGLFPSRVQALAH